MTTSALTLPLLALLFAGCGKSDSSEDSAADSDTGSAVDTHFPARSCETRFVYQSEAFGVNLAGEFNDWSTTATPMEPGDDGFEVTLDLAPGAYAYKFVEKDGSLRWTCDPESELFHCEQGVDASGWQDCSPGAGSCNSFVVVEDCNQPRLHVLGVDVAAELVQIELAYEPGSNGARIEDLSVEKEGLPQEVQWDGTGTLQLEFADLEAGRHRVWIQARDTDGSVSEPLSIPFWNDGSTWQDGLLYFPMVDRFANAESSNDWSEGPVSDAADYFGGDWKGIEEELDALLELGVRSLWLTAPQDNPEGAWGDKCGTDFSGYHGYWPSSVEDFEEHFGGEAGFVSLVDAAHSRGMRVMVDWVGNHVHQDHPYHQDHSDWFAQSPLLCQDANNWNDYPETCWFDAFLPDVNYSQSPALSQMIDDAVAFAKKYDLDGYRVDAVKHMPRAVVHNLVRELESALEYEGTNFEFYTLGETFDGSRDVVASYVGGGLLDGQFDFPLYFSLRSAMFGTGSTLQDLEASLSQSQAVYGDAPMSTFLGNHDVERFVSEAAEGVQGECHPDNNFWNPASPPEGTDAYQRLRLAWTWLLTRPGLPLVYYGDEIGLPGYFDPDNRQPMRFGSELSGEEAATRAHVRALGTARLEYPALSAETGLLWWDEAQVMARLTQHDEDWALSILNLSGAERALSNGLAWAGMPEGQWRDLLTGESYVAANDNLTVSVPALSSRVLIWDGS